MILKELQQFVAQHKKVSLADLQLHFRIDADALRGMLNRLIRKGRIRKMEHSKKCGGCHSCADEAIEFYEWVNTKELLTKTLTEG